MVKKILFVDDDRDLVASLSRVMKQEGYDVDAAYSAGEGLKKALQVKPDLIVLDVSMETDTAGFEFVYQLRNKRPASKYLAVRDVPVILLTAITQVTNSRFSMNDKESFLPSLDDFVTKPVKVDVLLSKIKSLL